MNIIKLLTFVTLHVLPFLLRRYGDVAELVIYPDSFKFGRNFTPSFNGSLPSPISLGQLTLYDQFYSSVLKHNISSVGRNNVINSQHICSAKKWISTTLLLCGDIHPCPGPTTDPPSKFSFFSKRGLHIIHLNVRSLLPKIDEVRLIANQSNAACICLSETWLDDSVFDT